MMFSLLGFGALEPIILAQTPSNSKPVERNPRSAPDRKEQPQIQIKDLLVRADATANEIKVDTDKAYALIQIAIAQVRNSQLEDGIKNFELASALAHGFDHTDLETRARMKAQTLYWIAISHAELGLIPAGKKMVSRIDPDRFERTEAIAAIAKIQAKTGDVAGAIETIEADAKKGNAIVLESTAELLAAAGQTSRILELAGQIQGSTRVRLLAEIAKGQFRSGKPDDAKKSIESAKKIAEGLTEIKRLWARAEIANVQDEIGDDMEATKTIEGVPGAPREQYLYRLVTRHAKAGKIAEAQKVARELKARRDSALVEIAVAQARIGDFVVSRQTINRITLNRSYALAEVSLICLTAGDRKTATELYREAFSHQKNMEHLWDNSYVNAMPQYLKKSITNWAEAGGEVDALEWVQSQGSPFVKAVGFAAIAEGIAKRRQAVERSCERAVP